jgi:tetratricopeptide (TPR) repeat protein
VLPLRILMVACAAGAMALRGPLGDANAMRREPGTRFMPDQRLAKLFSLGHRSTCADSIWLNAMGDLSRTFNDNQRKRRWLDSVFDTVTRLEPTFSNVYSWGATYLGMLQQDRDRAIALLEKGVAANPKDIRLNVELAMAYFEYRKDRAATLAVLERIKDSPDIDPITLGFYDSLKVDARADYAALALWAPWLDDPNEEAREVAQLFLERTKKEIFFRAWNEYQALHGKKATRLEQLRDPALMAPEVFDPVLSSVQILAGGKLRFAHLDELETRHGLRAASAWAAQFRRENGRLPTVDELRRNKWGRTVDPPAGQHYVIDENGVRFADD